MLLHPWRIEMLGGLRAKQEDRVVDRFRTRKVGALLAYLAYYRDRISPREELADLLWPEADLAAARHSLRQALATLRRQLEPPDVPPGTVVVADPVTIRLNVEAVGTDVAEFRDLLRAAGAAEGTETQIALLERAVQLYRGELLPGYYDDWVLAERRHLEELYVGAQRQLAAALAASGDPAAAIAHATRVLAADPLREASHVELIRLYAAAGRTRDALRQYRELEQILDEELGAEPSPETQALIASLRSAGTRGEGRGASGGSAVVSGQWSVVSSGEGREARGEGAGTSRPLTHDQAALASPEPRIQHPDTSTPQHLTPTTPTTPPPAPRLPRPFSRLFGREREISLIAELLSFPHEAVSPGFRALTLFGPGGSGKTRLAIAAAWRVADVFRGAVWFVPLADVAEPQGIPEAIHAALRLPRTAHGAPLDEVAEHLRRQPSLLVLDNFEHLLPVDPAVPEEPTEGAAVLRDLLERVPTLTCLVTSRHRLMLDGEVEFPVHPLAVPGEEVALERLPEIPSVQLFIERAQAARADFALTAHNAAAVAQLCSRLEGMPLAIELAAARAGALTPAQMLKQLEHRFDFLVARRRDASTRHQTLRAAVEWSYQLLAPKLQHFFNQLYVFRGGWDLEAAQAVGEEPQALEFLEQLRDRSLVLAEDGGGEMRFRMLEMLREYAAEQLMGPAQADLYRRHAWYFLAVAEQAEAALSGPEQAAWLARLEREHDNLRTALTWLLEDDAGCALRMATALFRFWEMRGWVREGRRWLERALGRSEGTSAARAAALDRLGTLAWYMGDFETARARLEEALSMHRTLGNAPGVAGCLTHLANVLTSHRDHAAARRLIEEGLALSRELEDVRRRQVLLESLTRTATMEGDFETARQTGNENLRLARDCEDRRSIAVALTLLGLVALNERDWELAARYLEEGLARTREIGDALNACAAHWGLGLIALFARDYESAEVQEVQALRALEGTGYQWPQFYVLETLAHLAAARRHPERAARLTGAVASLRKSLGVPLATVVHYDFAQYERLAREALGETRFQEEWQAGARWTLAEVLEEALRSSPAA